METSLLSTPTLFNIYIEDDILDCYKYLKDHFNNPNFYTVGISMGAGIVC